MFPSDDNVVSTNSEVSDMLDVEGDNNTLSLLQMLLFIIRLREYQHQIDFLDKMSQRTSILCGHVWIIEILTGNPTTCHKLFRLHRDPFISLCQALRRERFLKNTVNVQVEEVMAMFYMIARHLKQMTDDVDVFNTPLIQSISTLFA